MVALLASLLPEVSLSAAKIRKLCEIGHGAAVCHATETAHAVFDIEGKSDPRKFTVASDIDVSPVLVVDHPFEVMLDLMSEGSLVDVRTLFLRQQHRQQLWAARQAAHMCGQEAPFAAMHVSSLFGTGISLWAQPLCEGVLIGISGLEPYFRLARTSDGMQI